MKFLYEPTGQKKHSDDPVSLLLFPASQYTQVDGSDAALMFEYRPTSHGAQDSPKRTAEPVWYLPAGQSKHELMEGPLLLCPDAERNTSTSLICSWPAAVGSSTKR
jgi:hypothetical protein